MRRSLFRRSLVLGASFVLSLTAAACGASQAPTTPSAPASPSQPSQSQPSAPQSQGQAPATAGKPVMGGTFRMTSYELIHLDPHRIASGDYVLGLIYDGLVTFKDNPSTYNEYIVVPQLAEKWEISADGKTYTFTLRSGVKFHNGDPMTADDVVYSLERFRSKDAEAFKNYYFAVVDTIEKVNESTVRISLTEPFAPMLNYLAQPYPVIVNKKTVDANNGSLKQAMNGTGPFKFASYERGNKWIAEKNPAFWGKDAQGNQLPYLDKVEYIVMPDYAGRTAAFRARETDLHDWYRGPDVLQIPQSNPDSIQLKWTGAYGMNFAFNTAQKPFDDVRVRQAFSLAMDRRGVAKSVNVIGPGYLNPPISAAVGSKWARAYDNDAIERDLPNYKRDVAKAKDLLKQAGFENGLTVTSTFRRDLLNNVSAMEVFKDNLKEVGVELNLNAIEVGAHSAALAKKDFEIIATGGLPSADVDDALYGYYFTGASQNYGSIKDPKLDDLILKQRRSLKEEERVQTVREIEKYLAEQVYWLYVTDADYASSWQPWVKNFKRTFTYHVMIRNAWIDKK